MNRIEFHGEIYTLQNGQWYDSSLFAAPKAIQNELNTSIASKADYKHMSLNEIINFADSLKVSESYGLALQAYSQALEKSDIEHAKYILPCMTSCYRLIKQPEKAIELNSLLKVKFGNAILTPALLTSVAAAFCDIEEYEKAKKCCDRAYALSNGKASGELVLVYKRIAKDTK